MRRRFLRCSFILPVAQLTVCAVLLFPSRQWLAVNIQAAVQHRDIFDVALDRAREQRTVISPITVPIDSTEAARATHSTHTRFIAPAMLNFPAMVISLPYAMFSADHREWMPRGMDFEAWRSMTWPIVGLLFWWIAGRACDSLAALRHSIIAPRLRWLDLLISLISIIAGVLCLGLVIGFHEDPRIARALLAASGVLWLALGAATWIARIWQWRVRRVHTTA